MNTARTHTAGKLPPAEALAIEFNSGRTRLSDDDLAKHWSALPTPRAGNSGWA